MTQKNDNKSLFLYTALIFIVAMIMIIISFFGENHLSEKRITTQTANSISQKASILSDENMLLRESNLDMSEKIETYEQKIKELNENLDNANKTIDLNNRLMSANGYISKKSYDEAKKILDNINPDELTGDTKIFYDTLIEQLK